MILVTGGSGFLGAHLIRKLIRANAGSVRAIRRKKSSIPKDLKSQVEWIKADLLDTSSLLEAVRDVQEVYHCAALISFDPKQRDHMYQVNVEGTANMVNVALQAGVEKLLHVSSIAALGRFAKDGAEVDEQCAFDAEKSTSHYALCKYESEMQVWRAVAEGLAAVIVNPSIIIGPADNWKLGSARLITQAWEGLPFHPSGGSGFVDVRDCAEAMIQLMRVPAAIGERFILNGANASYQEFFAHVLAMLGKKPTRGALPRPLGEIAWRAEKLRSTMTGKSPILTRETFRQTQQFFKYSNQKVSELLNYEFLSLEQSLSDSCEAFLKQVTKSK